MNQTRISNSLDFISIHIPKTAGTSFRNTLKSNFGENNVVRLDIDPDSKEILLENKPIGSSQLSHQILGIHGHMYYPDIINSFEIKRDTKWITWLRNPVDRVISNYYYLSEVLANELDEKGKGLDILSKMQRTLIEFARIDKNRNRMSKFLEGADISSFDFLGIMEFYHQDLQHFADVFGIENIQYYHHNSTVKKTEVDRKIRFEIEDLNKDDKALYELGIKLRNERLNKR